MFNNNHMTQAINSIVRIAVVLLLMTVSLGASAQVERGQMNKLDFRMDIPVVTREYTPGSCRNSRKPMRLPPRHGMRPDSPALHAEQLRFPNQGF